MRKEYYEESTSIRGYRVLGYYTVLSLLDEGYEVINCSLPPMPREDLFPDSVTTHLLDISKASDEEIVELMDGVYAFMYAIGADERTTPDAPALKFFYEANVLLTQRLARLAVRAGVEKFIIYSSYFAEFAERLDEPNLKDQAYPHTRLLQEKIAFAEGEGEMEVMSIRLPYYLARCPVEYRYGRCLQMRLMDKLFFPLPPVALLHYRQTSR